MIDDGELLRRYAANADEIAFRELVDRHVAVIYGAALRQCGGSVADAKDVTQRVFSELARRAGSLANHPALLGWLHTTTRFIAMKMLREAARRLRRERVSAEAAELTTSGGTLDWPKLQELLDDAMGVLKDRERAALLLRFFQGRSLRDVGEQLHLTETAARSCIARALERLRHELSRRGLASTSAALGVALAEQSSAAVPAGLAGAVATAALSAGAAPGTALVTTLLMKKIMIAACLLLAVTEVGVELATLKARASLRAESAAVAAAGGGAAPAAIHPVRATSTTTAGQGDVGRDAAELKRLQVRIAQLKARPPGIVDAEMRPPANRGRTTPQNFGNTVAAAVRAGAVDQLAKYVVFADDTPESRAAFMAHFEPAVRARYQTPERLVVSIQMADSLRDPPVLLQFMDAPTDYQGVMLLKAWDRRASGREREDFLPLTQTAEGWGIGPVPLSDETARQLLAQIDPKTGDVRPPTRAVHP